MPSPIAKYNAVQTFLHHTFEIYKEYCLQQYYLNDDTFELISNKMQYYYEIYVTVPLENTYWLYTHAEI